MKSGVLTRTLFSPATPKMPWTEDESPKESALTSNVDTATGTGAGVATGADLDPARMSLTVSPIKGVN